MVEYALLLVAILLLAAGAYKALGPKVGAAATNAGGQL
jgi:Flp pilus assembly pilin Flp